MTGQSPVFFGTRYIKTKRDHRSTLVPHDDAAHVFAVKHLHAVPGKNPRLGRSVCLQVVVTVEVVFGNIQHCRRARLQRNRTLQLKARQFEHKGPGHRRAVLDCGQRVQHRQADVAGDHRTQATRRADLPGHRRHCAFAVGTGNRNHRRRITALCQRLRKQFNVAHHRHAAFSRLRDCSGASINAWTHCNDVGCGNRLIRRNTQHQLHVGEFAAQRAGLRRSLPGVSGAHVRAMTLQPAHQRQTGVAETNHHHPRTFEGAHQHDLQYGRTGQRSMQGWGRWRGRYSGCVMHLISASKSKARRAPASS